VRIVLGVGGGIAAYKAVAVLRAFTAVGHTVRVVPTHAALQFVGRATWEALSGEPATADVFEDVAGGAHVALGRSADLVVVAPATADLLARAAAGIADDLLTATLLVARCPVLLVPAMHTQMWQHAATAANVATLRARGVHVLDPDTGPLAGADSGPGRLPEPARIAGAGLALVRPQDLAGRRVVVSAGGTREPLDPVRFLGNRSTGRQGVALATAARDRGAAVTLVAADVAVPVDAGTLGPGIDVVRVETAEQLRTAMRAAAGDADAVVMAAAVADFRPATASGTKWKKRPGAPAPTIRLVENPDVLAELAGNRLRPGQVVVGFAAETGDADGDVLAHGRAKARRKGADLLAVNAVGDGIGFASSDNDVVILDAAGEPVAQAAGSKVEVAHALWDAVLPLLAPPPPAAR